MKYLGIPDFYKRFPTEESARQYIADRRWKGEPVCPRCSSMKDWEIRGGMHYKCGGCPNSRAKFSVRTGTVMEHSRVSLEKWLLAVNLMSSARKGFSSIQLAKQLGVTQKTASYIEHRTRRAYETQSPVLSGEIEVDETYSGGKEKNKRACKRLRAGRGAVGKATVFGLKERGGAVMAMHVEKTDRATLQPIIKNYVARGSTVYTDESRAHVNLSRTFHHETVSTTLPVSMCVTRYPQTA